MFKDVTAYEPKAASSYSTVVIRMSIVFLYFYVIYLFILNYYVRDVKLNSLCFRRAGKETTSKYDPKCVITIFYQVEKNLR